MRLLLHQVRGEQLVFWRTREAAVFIFAFPILLFLLLASVYNAPIDRVDAPTFLLAGLIGYGAANTAFAGIAITLVIRREGGILKRLRATPLPTHVLLAAILLSTVIVFALETVALFALGAAVYDTPFPPEVLSLAAALLLSSACFAALGFATAALLRSQEGASAAVNLILLPMAFVSGSFGSTRHLPAFLRAVGDVLPLKYAIELIQATYLRGVHIWERPGAVAVLLAWGAGAALVALRRFRWEPRND